MRKHLHLMWFVWIVAIAPAVYATEYTLQDVINASEAIANHTPSHLAASFAPQAIRMGQDTYEVRLFTFKHKNLPQAPQPTFRDFITQWNQLSAKPQQRTESFIPTDYFTATPEMKEKGYSYLLSLRKVTDPGLLKKLSQRRN